MVKIGLCRVHVGDPLGTLIKAETWEDYTHALVITDPETNEISEEYLGGARRRILADLEIDGLDVYEFKTPLMDGQEAGIRRFCAEAEAAHEPYSIKGLFEFRPEFRLFLGEPPDLTQLTELQAVHHAAICSQHVEDACVFGAGLPLLDKPDFKISPGDISTSVLLRRGEPLKKR